MRCSWQKKTGKYVFEVFEKFLRTIHQHITNSHATLLSDAENAKQDDAPAPKDKRPPTRARTVKRGVTLAPLDVLHQHNSDKAIRPPLDPFDPMRPQSLRRDQTLHDAAGNRFRSVQEDASSMHTSYMSTYIHSLPNN